MPCPGSTETPRIQSLPAGHHGRPNRAYEGTGQGPGFTQRAELRLGLHSQRALSAQPLLCAVTTLGDSHCFPDKSRDNGDGLTALRTRQLEPDTQRQRKHASFPQAGQASPSALCGGRATAMTACAAGTCLPPASATRSTGQRQTRRRLLGLPVAQRKVVLPSPCSAGLRSPSHLLPSLPHSPLYLPRPCACSEGLEPLRPLPLFCPQAPSNRAEHPRHQWS